MIIGLLLGVALAQEAPCPERPRATLVDALQASSVAWAQLDGDALDAAMSRVRQATGCMHDVAELDLVLQIHQAQARHAWTTYDPQASARAWLAVRDLAPVWTAAYEADVPRDHPVRELWAERPQWTTRLDEEPPGGWLVDGVPGREVPLDRAFVLQALGRQGEVAYTAWHLTAAEVPQTPWRTERLARVRRRGSAAAGVLAAGGVGLIAGSLVVRGRLSDPDTPDSELLALQKRSNALGGAGLATAGTSLLTLGLLWGVRW